MAEAYLHAVSTVFVCYFMVRACTVLYNPASLDGTYGLRTAINIPPAVW